MFTLCLFIDRRRRLIGLISLSLCNHSFACENTSHCGLGSTLQNLNNLLKCFNCLWTFAQIFSSSAAEPQWKRHARMNTTLPVSSLPRRNWWSSGEDKVYNTQEKESHHTAWTGPDLLDSRRAHLKPVPWRWHLGWAWFQKFHCPSRCSQQPGQVQARCPDNLNYSCWEGESTVMETLKGMLEVHDRKQRIGQSSHPGPLRTQNSVVSLTSLESGFPHY